MDAILERKRAAATVAAASRRWAASTAEALADRLRPLLREGETLLDLELLQRLLGREVELHWRRLETADQAHGQAHGLRGLRLGELAAATETLYRRVVDLRALLGASTAPRRPADCSVSRARPPKIRWCSSARPKRPSPASSMP